MIEEVIKQRTKETTLPPPFVSFGDIQGSGCYLLK
jgi:hypothetical protein